MRCINHLVFSALVAIVGLSGMSASAYQDECRNDGSDVPGSLGGLRCHRPHLADRLKNYLHNGYRNGTGRFIDKDRFHLRNCTLQPANHSITCAKDNGHVFRRVLPKHLYKELAHYATKWNTAPKTVSVKGTQNGTVAITSVDPMAYSLANARTIQAAKTAESGDLAPASTAAEPEVVDQTSGGEDYGHK